ncbi:DUF6538 domain-containing protein [Bradyrhizobium sp. sBnM-33]|uniref:DUF6538 domain-containing protein n=1 Tax=Bradyrhizobium sp. sBnM-33 TaxID=2831780 RepID=UPI001BCB040F|nr:DUF6538 domain-containing protein [Bradyrhizobium sp. sBnM-33]WOH48181.1 DUF6538 domain-containing protein [Bradyrhizobium sp. sBnM-33]
MPSYLRRRGHTWFFRWKWPKRLAGCGFPGELICSLKTSDVRIARRRAMLLVLKIELLMTSTSNPGRAELQNAVRNWIDDCIWRREVRRADTGGLDFFERDEIEQMGRQEAAELDGLFRLASDMFAPEQQAKIERILTGKEASDKYQTIIAAAAREIGLPADPNTVAGRLVERTILRGYATLLDEMRQAVIPIPREIAVEKKPAQPDAFIFTAFWDQFEQHKKDVREWKSDTAANAAGTKNIFDKLFPAATVAQLIDKPIASDFKTNLLLLPRHYARGDRKKMSGEKLLAQGRTLPQKERMQSPTVNKHVSNLAEYWDYLVEKKKIPADIENPLLVSMSL